MEDKVNKSNLEENLKKFKIKSLAFDLINTEYYYKENSEDRNNLSHNDLNFLLAKEFSIKIREKNPIHLLTNRIGNLYKKCQPDYEFEDIIVDKGELTNPSEGKKEIKFIFVIFVIFLISLLYIIYIFYHK